MIIKQYPQHKLMDQRVDQLGNEIKDLSTGLNLSGWFLEDIEGDLMKSDLDERFLYIKTFI